MKERDLMIGDLVTAVYEVEKENGEYELKHVPAIITGIDENGTLVDGSCRFSFVPLEKHDYGVYCSEIEPIPITAEILEKNGFVYESDGLTWYDGVHNKEQLYVYCPVRKNGNVRKIEILVNKYHFFAELNTEYYVHELQNALRLCGLNDLADNFKI